MRAFRRIWQDIKQGENIDLYATLFVAFGLVVLSLLGVASSDTIASLTLAVLGLLAISNLVMRHRLENLSQKLVHSKGFFTEEFPPDFEGDLESAEEVWLIGVTLSRVLKKHYGKLEEKILRGHVIRVLLVFPSGPALEMAASRHYPELSRSVERRGSQIRNSLMILCGLQKIAPDRVQIRTIQNPMTFGGFCLNPDKASGVLYLEHFNYRTAPDAVPKFTLRAHDGYGYHLFNKEIHLLWDSGVDWECIE